MAYRETWRLRISDRFLPQSSEPVSEARERILPSAGRATRGSARNGLRGRLLDVL